MDASLLPEPDSELGYSEHQLTGIFGDRMADFHEYMMMKAHAFGDRGPVYNASDVHRYVDHKLPPRSPPLSRGQVAAVLSARGESSS